MQIIDSCQCSIWYCMSSFLKSIVAISSTWHAHVLKLTVTTFPLFQVNNFLVCHSTIIQFLHCVLSSSLGRLHTCTLCKKSLPFTSRFNEWRHWRLALGSPSYASNKMHGLFSGEHPQLPGKSHLLVGQNCYKLVIILPTVRQHKLGKNLCWGRICKNHCQVSYLLFSTMS